MFNEGFWILVSFIIFIVMILKPVKKMLVQSLDSKITKISSSLREAASLKDEAVNLLNDAKAKRSDAMRMADEIINKAKVEAEYIISNTKIETLSIAKKNLDLFMQRMAIEESKFINDFKKEVIESATNQIQDVITNRFDQQSKLIMIDNSIDRIKKTIN